MYQQLASHQPNTAHNVIPTDIAEAGSSSVDRLPLGANARVVGVSSDCPELRHKLQSLGVVAGTPVQVVARALLGDPINVRVRGFTLSLRLDEASCVTVEESPACMR